ncbi:hypothetical protein Tcan_15140 [Toxocara canis]|uniref:Uncharacterized protein n=1 Tax=Toxocara canis TaxID=6265 RepID=A0A0B2V7Y2_TOXCA|nr:hypothetical protein Tcan_15140 [Toxocara canis]
MHLKDTAEGIEVNERNYELRHSNKGAMATHYMSRNRRVLCMHAEWCEAQHQKKPVVARLLRTQSISVCSREGEGGAHVQVRRHIIAVSYTPNTRSSPPSIAAAHERRLSPTFFHFFSPLLSPSPASSTLPYRTQHTHSLRVMAFTSSVHRLAPLLFVFVLLALFALGTDASDISVKIERHFPCSASSGPSKENLRIKFPSYKSPGVKFTEEKNEHGNKCFRMSGGKVEVFPPGLDGGLKYYVHVETRIGIHGKPERCVNADRDGCGGIGSCVHCDICKNMGGALKNFVQIFQKDKPAKCNEEGLPAGTYDDLSLRVCLPTKNELLPFLDQNSNRAEQLWDLFVSSRARSGNSNRAEQLWDLFVSSRARSGEIPLVIAARLFDRPINKLSKKELNDLLHGSKAGMIGCHWIYATVAQS